MRSRKLVALAALGVLGLFGCNGGQPRIYRVAVDETPIKTIGVPGCFVGNTVPVGRETVTEQNYRVENEWAIWTGVDQTEYLDLGQQTYELGNAPVIEVKDLILGSDKTFPAARTEQKQIGDQYTEVRQTSIKVTFEDYSFAPRGTIDLRAEYACFKRAGDCPPAGVTPDAASCTSALNFVARRIDAQQITPYNNNPQ